MAITRSQRHVYRSRIGHFVLLAVSLSMFACEEVVHLKIVAPAAIENAILVIDGQEWTRFNRRDDHSEAEVDVPPNWKMHIEIRKDNLEPIRREIEFRGYGRRTITIEGHEIKSRPVQIKKIGDKINW